MECARRNNEIYLNDIIFAFAFLEARTQLIVNIKYMVAKKMIKLSTFWSSLHQLEGSKVCRLWGFGAFSGCHSSHWITLRKKRYALTFENNAEEKSIVCFFFFLMSMVAPDAIFIFPKKTLPQNPRKPPKTKNLLRWWDKVYNLLTEPNWQRLTGVAISTLCVIFEKYTVWTLRSWRGTRRGRIITVPSTQSPIHRLRCPPAATNLYLEMSQMDERQIYCKQSFTYAERWWNSIMFGFVVLVFQ